VLKLSSLVNELKIMIMFTFTFTVTITISTTYILRDAGRSKLRITSQRLKVKGDCCGCAFKR
jgi:hypothetical protein